MRSQEAAWRPAPTARASLEGQQQQQRRHEEGVQEQDLPEEGVPPLKQEDIVGVAHNMPVEMLGDPGTDHAPLWCHAGPVKLSG